MQLNEIQKRFKNLMLDHPKALDEPPADFAALFNEGDIPLPDRLKVYRNNIVSSVSDAIIATYPIIEKLVGHEFMEMMSRSFVLESPPTRGCLNMYGAGFDSFIENYELAKALPYLPDMARLEIAMNDAYYAADDKALTTDGLTKIAPEKHLPLRDSVHLVSSSYPVDNIRDFCLADDSNETMNVNTGGALLMIYRPEFEVIIVKLEKAGHHMLSALKNGQTLEKALEETLNLDESFDFQDFLQHHIALETFCELKTNT